MLVVIVSEKHRKKLVEYAEMLFRAGINWMPMRYTNTPVTFYKNQRILYGPIYMRRMDLETHDLFKEIVLSNPQVSGISVVSGVSGLKVIDFDPAKNPINNLEPRIAKLVENYGAFIYIDRRIADKNGKRDLKGLKLALFIDQTILSEHEIVYVHSYQEEVNDKSPPPKTIFPSLRFDPETKEKSVYLKLSTIDLWEAYYDKDFKLLPEVMSILGVKVELVKITDLQRMGGTASTSTSSNSAPGKPILGLEPTDKFDTFEKMLALLKEVAKAIDCPGFLIFLEYLEHGEWIIPYELIKFGAGKTLQRSSWSIAENHIMRILAEFGIPKEVFKQVFLPRMEDTQREFCRKYQHGCVHKTESNDINTAFKFNEFGHEPAGQCIYLRYGLCPRDDCLNSVYGKLNFLSKDRAYAIRQKTLMS